MKSLQYPWQPTRLNGWNSVCSLLHSLCSTCCTNQTEEPRAPQARCSTNITSQAIIASEKIIGSQAGVRYCRYWVLGATEAMWLLEIPCQPGDSKQRLWNHSNTIMREAAQQQPATRWGAPGAGSAGCGGLLPEGLLNRIDRYTVPELGAGCTQNMHHNIIDLKFLFWEEEECRCRSGMHAESAP